MAGSLHGSARTTPRVRAELQASQEAPGTLAQRYGLSRAAVAKWRTRATTGDAPTGPSSPRSAVLTLAGEAMVAEVRRRTLLPLDDVPAEAWGACRRAACATASQSSRAPACTAAWNATAFPGGPKAPAKRPSEASAPRPPSALPASRRRTLRMSAASAGRAWPGQAQHGPGGRPRVQGETAWFAPGSHAPGSHAPGSHAPGSHAPGSATTPERRAAQSSCAARPRRSPAPSTPC